MTDQTRVYVTTCSLEISLKTQTEPDLDQAGHIEDVTDCIMIEQNKHDPKKGPNSDYSMYDVQPSV